MQATSEKRCTRCRADKPIAEFFGGNGAREFSRCEPCRLRDNAARTAKRKLERKGRTLSRRKLASSEEFFCPPYMLMLPMCEIGDAYVSAR